MIGFTLKRRRIWWIVVAFLVVVSAVVVGGALYIAYFMGGFGACKPSFAVRYRLQTAASLSLFLGRNAGQLLGSGWWLFFS